MSTDSRRRCALTARIVIVLAAACAAANAAAASSSWRTNGPSTDWFDPLNWTSGVPQAPGDAAFITTTQGGKLPGFIASPIGLASLSLTGNGSPVISGELLRFESLVPGASPRISADGSLTASIAAPIELAEGQTLTVQRLGQSQIHLIGPISGGGGIEYQSGQSSFFRVTGGNSYSGVTVVDIHQGSLDAALPSAFGNGSGATILRSGIVSLFEGTAEEFFVHPAGTLVPSPSATPYTGKINLVGGVLNGARRFSDEENLPVEIDSEVAIHGSGYIGSSPFIMNNTRLHGAITGHGLLNFQGSTSETITTEGPIELLGNIKASDRSNVIVAGALRSTGDITVDGGIAGGRLRIAGDATDFHGDLETRLGRLTIASNVDAGRMRVDARLASWRGTLQNGGLTVEPGATLSVKAFDFFAGSVAGRITGVDALVKTTSTSGQLERLEGFDGPIEIHEGWVEVRTGGLGTAAGSTSINARHRAGLVLSDARVEEAVSLNNAAGMDFTGALVGNGDMAGDLYLGDSGAYVGGYGGESVVGESFGANLTISGRIHGGALIKPGPFYELSITGGGHTYQGATEVLGGTLVLAGAGRLESTSHVLVGGGRVSHFGDPRATLRIDDRGAMASPDRLADSVPVHLDSGRIDLVGRGADVSRETIGQVVLEAGYNQLGSTDAALHINELVRQGGAVAMFRPSEGGRIEVDNAALPSGILGGWALYGTNEFEPRSFATVVGGQIEEAPLIQQPLDVSTAEQNVLVAGGQTLAADRTVNAIRTEQEAPIDLAGHRLTLGSGGLLSRGATTIAGGELTAGSGGASELIFHAYHLIDAAASIVDNGSPLALHVAGTGEVRLRGANTYTGGTTVSRYARLHVFNRSAVPQGDSLTINSGSYIVNFADAQPLEFSRIELREHAGLISEMGTPIDADEYVAFSGAINARLVGDGAFVKRGEDQFELQIASPDYLGPIVVEQGLLRIANVGGVAPTESSAIRVLSDGVLESGSNLTDKRLVILEGGAYRVGLGDAFNESEFKTPLEIRGSGAIQSLGQRVSETFSNRIFGQGDLIVHGPFAAAIQFRSDFDELDGDVTLAGGQVHLRADNSAYQGRIIVRAASAGAVHAHAIGPGGARVEREGFLSVDAVQSGPIELAGGTLQTFAPLSVIQKPLAVAADSTVNTPALNGTVDELATLELRNGLSFASGVALKKVGLGALAVKGPISVGADARLVAWEGTVDLGGQIVAREPDSQLDLVGYDNIVFNSSVSLPAGAGFQLRRHGAAAPLEFGAGAELSGSGTVAGDVQLVGGAVAPGASAGTLHVDGNLTLAAHARYNWELADHAGVAGTPTGWDMLDVAGALRFDATPSEPWRLALAAWAATPGPIGPAPGLGAVPHQWLVVSAENIVGFDPAAVVIDDSALVAARPQLAPGSFHLSVADGNLFLNYAVPEPASADLLAATTLAALAWTRRSRSGRRSGGAAGLGRWGRDNVAWSR